MSRYNIQLPKKENQDPFEDFEGNKAELYLHKFSHYLGNHRKQVFIGIGVVIFLLVSLAGFLEYQRDRLEKASVEMEDLQTRFSKNPSIDLSEMIVEYEKVREKYSTSGVDLRTAKVLADLYARDGKFDKAAALMEKSGTEVGELREVKAFYFFIAGNYREQQGDLKKALENFETASGLLKNMRNVPVLMSWSYFHTGRLYFLNKDTAKANTYLKKVLEVNGSTPLFQKARKLSTYLLLKINQG